MTTLDQSAPGVETTEWESHRLDVDAYLARLGMEGPLPATADVLRRLHRAHALAIPFENLDIVLGRGIDLDMDAMQDKLLRSPRGGYCYEHNMLFAALLDRLGFQVTRLYARPVLDIPKPLPRTHMALRVRIEGTDWLADVGFGDEGPLEPIPFRPGEDSLSDQGGWEYRLAEEKGHPQPWVVHLRRPDGWFPLYRFTDEAHHHIDCVVANHFISTHERSPFVGRVFLERIAPTWRLNLNNRALTHTSSTGQVQVTEIADEDLPDLLANDFGIRLTEQELATVTAALPAR